MSGLQVASRCQDSCSGAAFLFRFAKCRQQGMTHTTLETQPFTATLASSVSSPPSSGFHSTAGYLAGASAASISPIREEQPGYSTDCFEYDLPSQTQYYDGNDIYISKVKFYRFNFSEYCYGGPVGGSQGEPQFSYKVLPVDNYEATNFDQDLHSGYNACQPQV